MTPRVITITIGASTRRRTSLGGSNSAHSHSLQEQGELHHRRLGGGVVQHCRALGRSGPRRGAESACRNSEMSAGLAGQDLISDGGPLKGMADAFRDVVPRPPA